LSIISDSPVRLARRHGALFNIKYRQQSSPVNVRWRMVWARRSQNQRHQTATIPHSDAVTGLVHMRECSTRLALDAPDTVD
jgi:hypothetical protein